MDGAVWNRVIVRQNRAFLGLLWRKKIPSQLGKTAFHIKFPFHEPLLPL